MINQLSLISCFSLSASVLDSSAKIIDSFPYTVVMSNLQAQSLGFQQVIKEWREGSDVDLKVCFQV